MKRLKNKAGFTLAELLIVVAIIAILVAIGVPAFSTAMERSRETVDLSNIRGAYAEFMASALDSNVGTMSFQISFRQRDFTGWKINVADFLTNINGTTLDVSALDSATNGVGYANFVLDTGNNRPTLTITATQPGGSTLVSASS